MLNVPGGCSRAGPREAGTRHENSLTPPVTVGLYTRHMSKLLRYFAPGQYCFVTSVTAGRRPILVKNADILSYAVYKAHSKSRFSVVAWVVLPDHFHALFLAPDGDIARIMQRVKLSFSLQHRSRTGEDGPVWQHRYWDHIIRSEQDFRRHIDYIHYNPVKHGLMDSPGKWELTSFRRYQRRGFYRADWCITRTVFSNSEFGE